MSELRSVLLSLALLAVLALPASALYQGIAYNVTFLEPLNETVSGWLAVPGSWGSVSLGYTCLRPLNATALHLGGYTFLVYRGSAQAGESLVLSACNYTAPVSDGFVHHERLVLEAACPGEYGSFTTYRSGSSISYSYNFSSWVILHNVTVTVTAYVYPTPADVVVELCPEGYDCVSETRTVTSWGERFAVTFEGPWNTTGLNVSVSTQAWYSYFYAGITPRYTAPTSDSDSATLGPFDVALLEMGGEGEVVLGPLRDRVSGHYVLIATPYGSSLNGSYTSVTANTVTVSTSCYGVSVRRVLVVDYYASNLTREEVALLDSFAEQPPREPVSTIELALNATGISEALVNATRAQLRLAARVLAGVAVFASTAGWAVHPAAVLVGGMASIAAILAGSQVGDNVAVALGLLSVVALIVAFVTRYAEESASWLTR